MSQDIPADILLIIFTHTDPQTKPHLCLVSRYFHSIFAPLVLQDVRFLFCEEDIPSDTIEIDKHLKSCSGELPNLYRYTQSLRVKVQGYYLTRHVTRRLLPALWKTISRLRSLKSFELEWELDREEKNLQTMTEYLMHIVGSVMQATGGLLDRLTLIPDFGSQMLPIALKWVRGLKSLRVLHDPYGWRCIGGGSYLPFYEEDEHYPCRCRRQWMEDIIHPLISANPGLETLEILQGCHNHGLSVNHILPASLTALTSLTISGLDVSSLQTDGTNLVQPTSLMNLRHLAILASYRRFKIDAFWNALKVAKPPLQSLVSHDICESMVDYVSSFSGLQTLELQRIEGSTNHSSESPTATLVSTFLTHALPRHAESLERLVVEYDYNIVSIPGWDFDPHTWTPALSKLSKLRYLAIPPPIPLTSDSDSESNLDLTTAPRLIEAYQLLLDNVNEIPSLVTLKINICRLSSGCGTSQLEWSLSVQKTLDEEVVSKLRVSNGRPAELRIFEGVYRCVPLDGEGDVDVDGMEWGYEGVKAASRGSEDGHGEELGSRTAGDAVKAYIRDFYLGFILPFIV